MKILSKGVHAVLDGSARSCVVRADALELLKALPDECLDAIITDPPYSSGGAFRGDRDATPREKYTKAKNPQPDFEGDCRDQLSQLSWCALWLSQAYRAAKPGAPVCVWTDWRQIALTMLAVQCGGFVVRGIRPWTKGGQGRPQLGRFRNDAEYVVWGSKGAMPLSRRIGGSSRVLAGAADHPPVRSAKRRHLTEKPEEVMRGLVRICEPGGLILDPFAGGGSTGVAALREGYRFLGSEITSVYHARSLQAANDVELELQAA